MATSSVKMDSMSMSSEGVRASSLNRFLPALALLFTFLAYSGTLRYEFVYDDGDQIVGNRYLTSWSYLPRYFKEHLWSHRDFNLPGNYYRPLFLVWLRLNRSFLGLNATLWHLVTLCTYLGSVLVVYWLARRLLKDKLTAGLAALIFGLCPLHIETAAWVSGVTEPLLALLFVSSFLFYTNSREVEQKHPNQPAAKLKWLAASVFFFALALFSKETAIILPALILAYELICGDVPEASIGASNLASRSKTLVSRALKSATHIIPFIGVALIYLLVRAKVLGGVVYTPSKLPLTTKLLTVPSLMWGYVKLLFWPVGLSEFYDTPYVDRPGLTTFFLPMIAVVLVVTVVCWAITRIKDGRERRTIWFICSWLVIPILPVLNIATFRPGDLIHDRYLFLPTIGFSILIAYSLRKLKSGSRQIAGMPAIQALTSLLLIGLLGAATAYQHVYWANDIVLFHHSLTVAPGNEIAENAFGDALSKREMYDEAIGVFEGLVRQAPLNAAAHYNLGYNYYQVGRYEEALPHLATAVELNPKDERQFLTLGVTLLLMNKYDLAEQALREGIRLRRDGIGLHYALGAVFKQTGRLEDALNEFNQELAYNPQYVSAHDQINQIKQQMRSQTRISPTAADSSAKVK
jgi:Flp pilus assembly protein TadD